MNQINNVVENAPALELDKALYAARPMPPHVRRERRIVWNLIKHLATYDWRVCCVDDGEELAVFPTGQAKAALEIIFNLDDCWVYFTNGTQRHAVRLVLGNDIDIISDWRYETNDRSGFNALMEKFDAEAYA